MERARLHRLHDQLSQLPPADQLALLGDHRLRRRQIQNDIARAERAVEEIMRILSREPPPESPGLEAIPEEAISAWLRVVDARASGKATPLSMGGGRRWERRSSRSRCSPAGGAVTDLAEAVPGDARGA